MKPLSKLMLCVFPVLLTFNVHSESHQAKELATTFNKFVARDGKDKDGHPSFMQIDLECGNVRESIVMNGNSENPEPVLIVSKPTTFSVSPAINGGMWPEGMDFDEMNESNFIGWSYHYNAPNGAIDIYLKNSGEAETEVKASNSEKTLRASKILCSVVEAQ